MDGLGTPCRVMPPRQQYLRVELRLTNRTCRGAPRKGTVYHILRHGLLALDEFDHQRACCTTTRSFSATYAQAAFSGLIMCHLWIRPSTSFRRRSSRDGGRAMFWQVRKSFDMEWTGSMLRTSLFAHTTPALGTRTRPVLSSRCHPTACQASTERMSIFEFGGKLIGEAEPPRTNLISMSMT